MTRGAREGRGLPWSRGARPRYRAAVAATPPASSGLGPAQAVRPALLVAGLLLIGVNLRPGLTTVGPLVGDIQASTGISAAVAGLLTTLALLVIAAISPLAAPLARRVGMERTLAWALVVLAAGLGLRSAGPVAGILAGTALIGAAIALGNVLLPSLIKQDFPDRVGLMTGLFATTMVMVGGLSAGLSIPLADGAGLGWRGALACWALLAVVALAVWWPSARGSRHVPERDGPAALRLRRSAIAWQVTLFTACQSILFFALVAWLPAMLRDEGLSAAAAGWMLALLQVTSAAAAMIVPVVAGRRPGQERVVAVSSVVCLVSFGGLLATTGPVAMLWVALLGFGLGGYFALTMTLFVARAPDVRTAGALAGMAQAYGYLLAAAAPIGLGLLHDVTGSWTAPLLSLLAITVASLAVGLAAGRDRLVR